MCDGLDNDCDTLIDEDGSGGSVCDATPGDLDGDNDVDEDDYNLFMATYGRGLGDPDYNADADYDGDDFVGGSDFGIWYQYYMDYVDG